MVDSGSGFLRSAPDQENIVSKRPVSFPTYSELTASFRLIQIIYILCIPVQEGDVVNDVDDGSGEEEFTLSRKHGNICGQNQHA